MLLIDYHQTEWCPREGVQNAKVSLLYRQATYRKFRWQRSGWHTYEIRHRRPLVSRQDILTHSIVKTWRENNQSVRTYQHTKRKHFSILSSPPHNEVTRPKDNGLYSLTRSKKYWQNFFYKTGCARQDESKHSPGLTTLFVGKTDTLETSKCFLTTIFPSHCFSTNHSPSHISQPQVADSVLLRMRTYPFLLLLTQYAGAGKPVSSCQKAFMSTR